jgi:hypothetical protein
VVFLVSLWIFYLNQVGESAKPPLESFENGLAYELLAGILSQAQQAWVLDMRERIKRIQIPLLIAICLFVMTLPAYLRCTDFSGTKFASSDLFFQNPDRESGLLDSGKSESKVFGLIAFFTIFLQGTHLSRECSHLFSRPLSLLQKASILRC